MKDAIAVTDLYKVYPSGAKAVSGLTFRVGPGEIFGLLGPNGSGKTTTVRVLATLLPRTSGSALVRGFDVTTQPQQVRQMIGYAGQFIGVDEDLTARENLILQGRLHGMPAAQARRRSGELLEAMGLTAMANVRTNRFSGGMRRRVDLVQALMHRPPVLFLDEPTTGMDLQSRNALWRYLDLLKREGMSILLTTQYLEEADRACDRIAIIDSGRLVSTGTPRELKDEIGTDRLTITLSSLLSEDPYARAAEAIAGCPGVTAVEEVEPLVLSVRDVGASLPQVIVRLQEAGLRTETVRHAPVSMDDVFLHFTGHKVRADHNIDHGLSAMVAMVHGRRHSA